MRRVVVTGLGIVSPVGIGLDESWNSAIRGKSGIAKITQVDLTNEPVQIGGEVKNFDPTRWMNEKEAKRTQRFVQFGIVASRMALEHAGLTITDELAPHIGVSVGVGVGGMAFMEENVITMTNKGSKWVSPFTIPGFIANMAAGGISIDTHARGPNICTTTACAAGTHSIGEALMLIQTGRAKAMIAGGAESTISHLPFAGFGKMGALCKTFNDNPTKASRPFDKGRCGFVMGEGSGILILEEMEFAKARGANIICELVGYGLSGDGYHITLPSPGGEGASRAMKQALETAQLRPDQIGYINAHGTSTEANDQLETSAIKTVFGEHARKLNISSTKSVTGHLLGAAGGVEAVFSVMALKTGIVPPTINQETSDPDCDLNYTPNEAIERPLDAVISNSFGFGGTNACLAFRRI
jgi:3-oxoacyl-[acyl-carrier-protein] synthase II